MRNGKDISVDEAGEWLREHFENDPAPRIDIGFREEEPDPVAYRRILEILFRPGVDTRAA
ncbi:hypothetical protein C0Q60_03435 [Streptomyces albidoflavus]|nr:hypothetical protein C0Q60_03435 [Streptomyces albidoflavus]RZE04938.1 hypothetical protein C0Q62_03350 [Streptomyces albidoflavus]